jgi:hypothetical protein
MLGVARVVHESDFFRIERLANPMVIRITRLATPFRDAEDVEKACRPLQDCLNLLGRARMRLLIDSREAVGNNDPASEANFAAHRKAMSAGFPRVAVLVKSTIGLLHVKRLLASDGTPHIIVFNEEADAMAYLIGK